MMKERTAILSRMFVVFGLIVLVPCVIALQLLRINFLEGDQLRELWSNQAIDTIRVPAQRGNIYDDDGSLLATNTVAYKVALDPRIDGLTRDQIGKLCKTLAGHTALSASDYLRKIDRAPSRSRYVVLADNVNAEAYEAVRSLGIHGVILEENYKRRYNFGMLAAHVLGFVNYNMDGVTGLEKKYDDKLRGIDGVQQVRRDRNGRIFAYVGAPRRQPRQGYSLYTTIDSQIQAILEEELKAGILRTKSNYGSAIVMDPQTGAIKAMANYPTFNPNNPASSENENRRNYAVSDMIEPGSTFKLVTAIAAVEQDVVSFDEKFTTPKSGQTLIHGQWMRDHDPLGTLTFTEVIKKSSNVATSEIARRLSRDVFYQYARNLGFGTLTNIDLPSEESGRLQKPYEWSRVSLPWMAIGYEVLATPIQLIQAYAAFANGGIMMRPYLVEKITDQEENIVWKHDPVEVRRVARKETVEKLYPVFREVVTDSGTAAWAQVEGLSIAGKTGTTQKYINGQYRSSYRASFVGFFPTENPRYVVMIVLDEPETSIYGGRTAGPIFRETAKRIAGLDNQIEKQMIEHDELNRETLLTYVPNLRGLSLQEAKTLLGIQRLPYDSEGNGTLIVSQNPAPGTELQPGARLILTLADNTVDADTTRLPDNYAVIPDVGGMSMRKASMLLIDQGFGIRMIGSGTVSTQFPGPGDFMEKGRTVTIRGQETSMEILAGR